MRVAFVLRLSRIPKGDKVKVHEKVEANDERRELELWFLNFSSAVTRRQSAVLDLQSYKFPASFRSTTGFHISSDSDVALRSAHGRLIVITEICVPWSADWAMT